MIETVTRKRIEIVADTPIIPRIVKLIKQCNISGWSLIHVDAGGGRGGEWQHDEVTGAAAKTVILLIANETKATALIEIISPLLTRYGLLLTMGEVEVVRGERF